MSTVVRANLDTRAPFVNKDGTLSRSFGYPFLLALRDGASSLVNLVTDVTGRLPYANMPQLAASRLLGRGSAAGTGNQQAITLGAGVTMTGTVLSATGTSDTALPNILMLGGM